MTAFRALAVLAALAQLARVAAADPDPKRKVVVLEYRAGSAALPGIATRVVGVLGAQTSLVVLGPDQTRALYGEHLDQMIVRCAGEAECIAKIGLKLGAAEVILVGVSEMGDVILTMQRIDVGGRAVSARIADSIASGGVPSEEQLGQYLARLLPPGDFLRFGVLDIIANEAGAMVTIGGQQRGLTPIQAMKLHAPATYEVKVEKRGFVPFAASVKLPPDSEIKLPVQLQRPGTKAAWYQHWYVLTGAAIIVAGAAGTTIYFATQKSSDHVPVSGNLN
jgi:hypothetical protein